MSVKHSTASFAQDVLFRVLGSKDRFCLPTSGLIVEDSILFAGVNIGRHAKVRRAILDKGVAVPPEMEIGYDLEIDRARGFKVTPSGVVTIGKIDGFDDIEAAQSSWFEGRL